MVTAEPRITIRITGVSTGRDVLHLPLDGRSLVDSPAWALYGLSLSTQPQTAGPLSRSYLNYTGPPCPAKTR